MTSTIQRQAFAFRYVRQIGTKEWMVTAKPAGGLENLESRGVISWATALWESESRTDESFLSVTVIVEGESESQCYDEARKLADAKLMERHPEAIIRMREPKK